MADEKIQNNLPGADDTEKIINLVRANYTESDDYLRSSGYRSEQKTWHDLYRNIPKAKKEAWMSNKFIPMIMSKVDSALSTLMDILFQIKPPIEVKVLPYGKGDEFHAGLIKTLLAKQTETDEFFIKICQYLKNLLIYGTSMGYVCWEKSVKTVYRRVKLFERMVDYFGKDVTEAIPATRQLFKGYDKKREVVDKEGPTFEPANIGDVFPDPQSIEINDGFLTWKIRRSISRLRENMKSDANPSGMYNSDVMKLRKEDSCETKSGKAETESNMGRQWDMPVTREDLSTNVEIVYWFGKYDNNNDGVQENCIFALAANKYLIRRDADIYWHGENGWVKGGYSLVPNDFFDIGIPEQLVDLQDNLNETVNQRIDNITLCLNPIAKAINNQGLKTGDIVMGPGKTVRMDDVNALTWDRPPDVTQSNFAHTGDIERWAQEVSIPKITMGVSGSELNRTATGMNILAQGAMDKSMLVAKLVESTSFSKILRLFYELDYQMLDEYKIAALVGLDNPKLIDMDKMNPDYYDISPAGVKIVGDKNQKLLKILQALNIFKDEPSLKRNVLIRKAIELMTISDNPNELMYTEQETAKIIADKKQEEIARVVAMTMMQANMKGEGPGRESSQFKGGETNMASAGGVPPNTVPSAPEQEVGAP